MGLRRGATSRGWEISAAKTLGDHEVLEHVPGGSGGFVIVERALGSGGFSVADPALPEDSNQDHPPQGRPAEAGLEKGDQRHLYFAELNLFDLHRFKTKWVSKAALGARLSTSTCSCKA